MHETNRPVILLVHDGEGGLRGSERVMLGLIEGLPEYSWHLLTSHDAFAAAVAERGGEVHRAELGAVFAEGNPLRDVPRLIRQALLARKLIRRLDARLVHVNNATFSNWCVLAGWWCGVPVVAHLHSMLSPRIRLRLGVHAADRIIAVSRAVLAPTLADSAAAPRGRVVYNGFSPAPLGPLDRAEVRDALGIAEDRIVLGVIGFLQPLKRIDVAIDAMRLLPPAIAERAVLLIIGEGPERARLEQRAEGLPVRFLGQRDDVPRLLAGAIDLLLMPSELDAFSTVLLEAAAFGVPRIAADASGNPELVRHMLDGLLVPSGEPAPLAAAIEQLVRDPALSRRLAAEAAARVAQDFTLARFLDGMREVLGDAMRTLPSRRQRVGAALASFGAYMRHRRLSP